MLAVATKGRRLSEPRIPPRPSAEWDEDVRDALSALRPPGSARRAPEPGRERPSSNILGIFSWHPALAKAFFAFNSHLFHSTLSARDRELVTVRAAWLRRGEYEWAQHVRMAKTAGMSDEEVDAISAGPGRPSGARVTRPCSGRSTRSWPTATSATRPGSGWASTSTAGS